MDIPYAPTIGMLSTLYGPALNHGSKGASRRVVITSKDLVAPVGGVGGVVKVVSALMRYASSNCSYIHFRIGRRSGGLMNPTNWLFPLIDAYRLLRLAKQTGCEIVHLNPSFNLPSLLRDGLAMLALRGVPGCRPVVLFHGWEVDLAKRVSQNAFFRWLFRSSFGSAARILVLSPEFAGALQEMGYPGDRVATVSSLFDSAEIPTIETLKDPDRATLLFLSRLVPHKGAELVIDAFALLLPEFPNLRLLIAGDGPLKSGLERRAVGLGVMARLEFLGFVQGSEKVNALGRAGIFVFPATATEGCPVAVLEAMGTGLPIVCSGAGGLSEIVTDGVNGIVAEPPTADSVASAIRQLLVNPDLTSDIGNRNRVVAWGQYEARVVTRKFEALYADVATERR